MLVGLYPYLLIGNLRLHKNVWERLREAFDIPEEYELFTSIAVRYPGRIEDVPADKQERETAPRERKPQGTFAHWGVW